MALSEGFGFEERWVRCALSELARDPGLFDRSRIDHAQRVLGIGNRKVMALWDWLEAAAFVTGERASARLTPLAKLALHYDPELREMGSLWIVHTNLSIPAAGIWFYHDYSLVFDARAFSKDELRDFLASRRSHSPAFIEKKCLAPLLQVMRKTRLGSDLGIMVHQGGDSFVRKCAIEESLSPAVFAYAALMWARSAQAVTANILQFTAPGGAGRLFTFDQSMVKTYLNRVCDRYGNDALSYSGTAGLDSVAFSREVEPLHLIEAYYLEQLEGREPHVALEYARSEGLSARLLADSENEADSDG